MRRGIIRSLFALLWLLWLHLKQQLLLLANLSMDKVSIRSM